MITDNLLASLAVKANDGLRATTTETANLLMRVEECVTRVEVGVISRAFYRRRSVAIDLRRQSHLVAVDHLSI